MLLSDNLVRVWLKVGVKTSAPSSVSENMSLRGGGLDGRHRLPMAIWISLAPTMVRGDEDLDAIRPSGGEDLPHMLDNVVRLECRAAAFVELAARRQKVVVGIDDKQPRQFSFVSQLSFRPMRHTGTPFVPRLLRRPWDGFTRYSTSSNLQLGFERRLRFLKGQPDDNDDSPRPLPARREGGNCHRGLVRAGYRVRRGACRSGR